MAKETPDAPSFPVLCSVSFFASQCEAALVVTPPLFPHSVSLPPTRVRQRRPGPGPADFVSALISCLALKYVRSRKLQDPHQLGAGKGGGPMATGDPGQGRWRQRGCWGQATELGPPGMGGGQGGVVGHHVGGGVAPSTLLPPLSLHPDERFTHRAPFRFDSRAHLTQKKGCVCVCVYALWRLKRGARARGRRGGWRPRSARPTIRGRLRHRLEVYRSPRKDL